MTGAGDGERLEGVTCIAAPEGGYEVSLCLIADLVALYPLAERVRRRCSEWRASSASTWRM